MFHHILIATDGSLASEQAAQLAVSLASTYGARLTAVCGMWRTPIPSCPSASPTRWALSVLPLLSVQRLSVFYLDAAGWNGACLSRSPSLPSFCASSASVFFISMLRVG